jgi:hypothetical protein
MADSTSSEASLFFPDDDGTPLFLGGFSDDSHSTISIISTAESEDIDLKGQGPSSNTADILPGDADSPNVTVYMCTVCS